MFPRTIRRELGSAMVEFALAFLFFFVVVMGLVELGRGAWAYSTVAHATRQGARFAQVRGSLNPATGDEVAAVVKQYAMGLDISKVEVTTTWEGGIDRGNIVQVRVRYPFAFLVSTLLFNPLTDQGKVTLGNTSRMVVAN